MKKQDLSKSVMKEIKKRDLKMKPKIYFILGSLLLGVGMAGVIILAAFFTHLIFFRLRVHGPFSYLIFGRIGMRAFLINFPWLPLILTMGGLVGGVILLKHYDISYKKSFITLTFGLLALVLTLGFFADRVGFGQRAERLKPLRPFYQQPIAGKEWVVGRIVQIEENQMEILNLRGEKIVVVWDKGTLMPSGGDFKVDEHIRAVGERKNEKFVARGIMRFGGFLKNQPLPKKRIPWQRLR